MSETANESVEPPVGPPAAPLTEPPTAPAQPTAATAPSPEAAPDGRSDSGPAPRRGTRTGPIVWGALILAFCGYVAQRLFGEGGVDTTWWITATVIGLGALLLVVGLGVLIRGRRDP
ncbi:MAG: hypothetical protein ACK5LO_10845 [Leucobacter sp.]